MPPATQRGVPGRPVTVSEAMLKVLRLGLTGAVAAAVVAVGIGYLVDGGAGAVGGLLGIAVPVGFLAVTAVVGLVTARLAPHQLAAAVMGSWLIKIILLMVVLWLLQGRDFFSTWMFFGAFLVGTFGFLALEAVILYRARLAYVNVDSGHGEDGEGGGR
ncbi:hypothetical protein GCM10010145_09320 [Streptomyces ruber]|uniref:ATP synthase protein I n=2 Tax=Streptomyces TaxID=1883 RepID=A0A918B9X2_9ACTN|nr:hypothetical protein [Streptomyces ruber]GGQ42562.1 hypothetical protein GCM10010145_09320 [Streptomyces ruber]